MNEEKSLKDSIPKCVKCGKPYKYSETVETYYPDCDCREKEEEKIWNRRMKKDEGKRIIYRIRAIKECGMGKRFKDKRFSNYDRSLNPKAYDICLEYAKNFIDNLEAGRGLFITGDVGTGKTHLASAIVDHIARLHKMKRRKPFKIIFSTSSEILSDIKFSFKDDRPEDCLEKYKKADLLIIDEIGAEKVTEWSYETLYQIINYRYSNMIPTILISNLNDKELSEQLDRRIASRIYEMCKGVKLAGEDRRIENMGREARQAYNQKQK